MFIKKSYVQTTRMSKYSYEEKISGFLSNESSNEKQYDSEWISINDREEDVEYFHLPSFDSCSGEQIIVLPGSCTSDYFVSKTEKWHTKPIANNAGRAAVHNIVGQTPGPTRFAKYQC